MAGRNQHHIPQFLQRGFGVPRSGKPKEIWDFAKGRQPKLRPIKEAAAEFDFYAPPSDDGSETLDDKITNVESPLAIEVAALRKLPFGTAASSLAAAEVVSHLAPRTSHLRLAFAKGMTGLFRGAAEVFGDQANIKRLLGLDGNAPSERFSEHLTSALSQDARFKQIGLPEQVLEQVAFRLAKENFGSLFAVQVPMIKAALGQVLPDAEAKAKEGHNKALDGLLENNVRRDDLAEFFWTVEAAPSEGVLLPDCVALGIENGGVPCPFMMAARDELAAVIMPLASDRLLVGRRQGTALPDLSNVNADAAACSHSFFLAASDKSEFADLVEQIGARSTTVIDAAIEGAIGEYRAPLVDQDVSGASATARSEDGAEESFTLSKDFSYQLTFLDCADQATAERIGETVRAVVGGLSRVLPMNRLEGITFASDYAAGLASVDVGVPGIKPPETSISEEIGVGVAMTIHVVRDDVVKCRIVLAGGIGPALIDEDHPAASWALHVLVHELALVAMTHWFDEAFPDVLFKPWADPHEGRLYVHVNASLDGYVASRISSGFGDQEAVQAYRDLLVSALARARKVIPAERLAYRTHGDLGAFADVAYPAAGHILQFAAKLLGQCEGQEVSPFDDAGSLVGTLDENGLRQWFDTFGEDLQAFWERRGRWESLDEVFLFNRHLERILWQFGVFPWRTADGESRVEIPIATDVMALLQGMADGTVPIPEGVDPANFLPES